MMRRRPVRRDSHVLEALPHPSSRILRNGKRPEHHASSTPVAPRPGSGNDRHASWGERVHAPGSGRAHQPIVKTRTAELARTVEALRREIGERARAEGLLRDSEERFRSAFAEAAIGMALLDTAGRFVWVNRAYCQITGYADDELYQTSFAAIVHPEDLPRNLEQVRQVVAGEIKGFMICKRYIRKSGEVVWTQNSVLVLRDDSGAVINLLALSEDITARKQAEDALRASEQSLRALAGRQQDVREEERTRIAREIHDELGQALTGLMMDVVWLESGLPRSVDDLKPRLKGMGQVIDRTIQSVRKIASELRPDVLDDLGLVAAIEWQAQAFQARSGVRCSMSLPERAIELDPARATAVFRILQEILTNVARHAAASAVSMELAESDDELLLTVRDNGIGIRPGQLADSNSLGILGMRERAMVFGGTVDIIGLRLKGTLVRVRIPLGLRAGAKEESSTAVGKTRRQR